MNPSSTTPVLVDAAAPPCAAADPSPSADGIPVGRYWNIVCWWPVFGGGYWLHDPERPDRTRAYFAGQG